MDELPRNGALHCLCEFFFSVLGDDVGLWLRSVVSYFAAPAGFEALRSACLYVCGTVYASICRSVRSHISQNHMSKLHEISVHVTMAVARSFSDGSAIHYVFPVLWMALCLHIMGQMQIQAWSLRCSELFTVTRQLAPLNCASGVKSAIADCLV